MWSGEGASRLHYMIQIAHNHCNFPRASSSDNVQNECRDAVLRNRRDTLIAIAPPTMELFRRQLSKRHHRLL